MEPASASSFANWHALIAGLRVLGYVQGKSFTIDYRWAKAIGLTIPQELLFRANKVIE